MDCSSDYASVADYDVVPNDSLIVPFSTDPTDSSDVPAAAADVDTKGMLDGCNYYYYQYY